MWIGKACLVVSATAASSGSSFEDFQQGVKELVRDPQSKGLVESEYNCSDGVCQKNFNATHWHICDESGAGCSLVDKHSNFERTQRVETTQDRYHKVSEETEDGVVMDRWYYWQWENEPHRKFMCWRYYTVTEQGKKGPRERAIREAAENVTMCDPLPKPAGFSEQSEYEKGFPWGPGMTPDELKKLQAEGFDTKDKDALVQKRIEKDNAYVSKQRMKKVQREEMVNNMNYVMDEAKEAKIMQERDFRMRQRADLREQQVAEQRAADAAATAQKVVPPKPVQKKKNKKKQLAGAQASAPQTEEQKRRALEEREKLMRELLEQHKEAENRKTEL